MIAVVRERWSWRVCARSERATKGGSLVKKLLALLAITLALAVPALAEGPVDTSKVNKEYVTGADGKSYTIATVVKVDGIAWFDRMREGVEQFKSETGADVWMVGPSSADAAAQVQI